MCSCSTILTPATSGVPIAERANRLPVGLSERQTSASVPTSVLKGIEMSLDWKKRAACSGQPVSLFHPDDPNRYRYAIKVCRTCSVRQQCLDYAMKIPGSADRFGVYGGLTPPQRRRLRRAEKSPAETPLEWNVSAQRYEAVKS